MSTMQVIGVVMMTAGLSTMCGAFLGHMRGYKTGFKEGRVFQRLLSERNRDRA